MSKTALLEAPRVAGPIPAREDKLVWAQPNRSSCRARSAKQALSPAPALALRLRTHLASLTELEASALFSLVHPRATGDENSLLKCVAGEIGVSEALIVKMAKKLGFAGFRQLREALAEHNRLAQADLQEELCVAEGACARLQKVLRASVRAIEQGLASVSPEALERAASCLYAARQRDFYGEGGSGQVARDAAHQFLRIGVRASVFDDSQQMLMSAALLRRGDAVMAFSYSGQTAAILKAARQARQNGARLIAVTSRSDSPLSRESDVALCANLRSSPWAGENAAARLVQLSVLDALLSAVAQIDYAAAERNVSRTAAALGRSNF
ncbi:MAG: SIS domain-containing protein [Verrucomicrobia bacterium]|nr:SIS domain-containing protein [Verrucomicrobiota bacterium]